MSGRQGLGFTLIIHSICSALDFTFRMLFLVPSNTTEVIVAAHVGSKI